MRSTTVPRRPAYLLALAAGLLPLSPARADLESYVKARDECFSFTVHSTSEIPGVGTALVLRLVSQKWQGITWEHWLTLIRPEKVTRPEFALLVISGGSIKRDPPAALSKEALVVATIAKQTGSVIAVLTQVPNQPLFNGLREDALIAHTFMKFLETSDDTWPCLLPMTKSAVRAMDAVQAVLKDKYSQEVRRFVVTGASKRGWTTWLTGAVDARVAAIAPMVIDTLNMAKQMPHQILSFGKYSEEIQDYTELNLPQRLKDPISHRLLGLVDPYSYLKKLTMPKLIVLGTNDRYWPVDAVKMYFGDLPGENYLHDLPNAGHGLGPDAIQAVAAFYQSVIAGEQRPRFTWSLGSEGEDAILSIKTQDAPQKVEFWKADSDTRDFRDSRWTSSEIARDGGSGYQGRVGMPAEGFRAFFARLAYQSSLGHLYYLSTNVEVVGTKPRTGG